MRTAALLLILPLVSRGVFGGKYFSTPNGAMYYIESSYEHTWFDAYINCNFRGMSLYTVGNQSHFDELYQLLTSDKFSIKPPNLWIGAVGVKDMYVWLKTRKPLAPHLWGEGNPDNFGDKEHCVHIWHTKKYLNDCDCLDKFGFVCEMDDKNVESGSARAGTVDGKYKGLTINIIGKN